MSKLWVARFNQSYHYPLISKCICQVVSLGSAIIESNKGCTVNFLGELSPPLISIQCAQAHLGYMIPIAHEDQKHNYISKDISALDEICGDRTKVESCI